MVGRCWKQIHVFYRDFYEEVEEIHGVVGLNFADLLQRSIDLLNLFFLVYFEHVHREFLGDLLGVKNLPARRSSQISVQPDATTKHT